MDAGEYELMHPVILTEYYQTKRQILRVFAFYVGIIMLFGFLDMAWVIFVVFVPSMAAGFGQGMFQEEYTKNEMKYLFSLPVSRNSIFLVKLLSGLGGCLVFIAAGCAALYLSTDISQLEEISRTFGVGFLPTVGAWLVYCLYCFFGGMLAMGFCRSAKSGGMLKWGIMALPTLLIYGTYLSVGSVPGAEMLATIFAVASLIMFIGAFVLYHVRNPYIEQAWLWRGIGGSTTGLCSVWLIGALALGGILGTTTSWGKDVFAVSPSPGGEYVLVTASGSLFSNRTYVLDSTGGLVHEFEEEVAPVDPKTAWNPSAPEILVSLPDEEGEEYSRKFSVFNLQTKEFRTVQTSSELGDHVRFGGWTAGGRFLIWLVSDYNNEELKTKVLLQGSGQTNLREFQIDGPALEFIQIDDTSVGFPLYDIGSSGSAGLLVINLSDGSSDSFVFDARITSRALLPKLGLLASVERYIDTGNIVRQAVTARPLYPSRGETPVIQILVDSGTLPFATVQNLADNTVVVPEVYKLGNSSWISVSWSDSAGMEQMIVKDLKTGKNVPLERTIVENAFSDLKFSPAGTKFMARHAPPSGDAGDTSEAAAGDDIEESEELEVFSGTQFGIYEYDSDANKVELLGIVENVSNAYEWLDADRMIYSKVSIAQPTSMAGGLNNVLHLYDSREAADRPFVAVADE